MKTLKLLHQLRGAGCVLTSACLILGGIGTASAFDTTTRTNAYAAWKNTFYYTNSHGGRFRNQVTGNGNTSFWQGAEMIECVEDAVESGLDSVDTVNQLCRSYTNDNSLDWSWNQFNDDLGWASMAFSRAYQLTGNTTYRDCAKNAADVAWSRGWDTVNGGMFQKLSTGSKCTCANAPNGVASYMLYKILGDSTYLTRAQNELSWMETNVYDSSTGNVIEGPGAGNPSFSYDSGGFATLAFWLGNTTEANKAGDWVTNHWGTSMQSFGQGSDAGGFNGICLRGLARTGHMVVYLQAVADKAWSKRNNANLTSVSFGSVTPNGTNLWCWDCSDMVAALACAPLPGALANGTYNMVNLNSGLNADVWHSLTANGTPVNQYTNNGGVNQKWQVTLLGGDTYSIIGVPSGRALEVVGGGTGNGTFIDIWDYSGLANQQWRLTPTSGGYYRLTPQNATSVCLDVQHSGITNSTPLEIWTYGGGNSQQWKFQAP